MDSDLQYISKPLETLAKGGPDKTSSGETKIYFDDLHLSPIKVKKSLMKSYL